MLTVLLLALLVGCASPTPTPVPPTRTPAPTATPEPTATPAPKLGIEVPLRIMAMGDHLTEGLCDVPENCDAQGCCPAIVSVEACAFSLSTRNPNANGYRGFLRDLLLAGGTKMTYVGSVQVTEGLAHEGHTHITLSGMNFCVQKTDWLETAKPDVILLHIGTTSAASARPVEEMATTLTTLLTSIYAKVPKTTAVIVAQIIPAKSDTIPPLAGGDVKMNVFISGYDDKIPGIVDEFHASGHNVYLVDMRPAVQSDDEFTHYGVYVSAAVYERMAKIWYGKLVEIYGLP
jgi:hypothetical protein